MKVSTFLSTAFLILVGSLSLNAQTDSYQINDLIKKWENNGSYTLAIIDAMPEADFDFRPTTDMMTFRKQTWHIANTVTRHMERFGHPGLTPVDTTSKATILESYATIFKEVLDYLPTLSADPTQENNLAEIVPMWYDEASTRNRFINLMDNHISHHRGQMIVYLRLKGVTPPQYVGW